MNSKHPNNTTPALSPRMQRQQRDNARLVKRLGVIVIGMFVFAVGILPPMYDAICQITGLNGKTANEAASTDGLIIDEERTIKVLFVANTSPDMPWTFEPVVHSMTVHPGEIYKADFYVHNTTNERIVGQAIPSVVPAQATAHFKKTECFCFKNQALNANTDMNMPLIFYIDPDLPKSVTSVTLSYQLFNISDNENNKRLAQK